MNTTFASGSISVNYRSCEGRMLLDVTAATDLELMFGSTTNIVIVIADMLTLLRDNYDNYLHFFHCFCSSQRGHATATVQIQLKNCQEE